MWPRPCRPIRAILRGDDSIWKYWVANLLCDVEPDVRTALEQDVARICQQPTKSEVAEEVDVAMRNVLFLLENKDPDRGWLG